MKIPRRTKTGFPHGYVADEERADIFDPALMHHPRAFVKGDPRFGCDADELAFHADRAHLMERYMARVGDSPFRDDVVLRGSATLAVWYGSRARRAKDIDLVVRAAEIKADSREGQALLEALRSQIASELSAMGSALDPSRIPIDAIWTYDRAEGRRFTCPWSWRGQVQDSLQFDVVFEEHLHTWPARTLVQGSPVWFASREESLAWKLLWLSYDTHPQAKDLYDAVLLAEDVRLPEGLLARVVGTQKLKHDPWNEGWFQDVLTDLEHEEWPRFVALHPYLALPTYEGLLARFEAARARSSGGL